MIDIQNFFLLADAYCDAACVEDKTLSYRMFDDGKKIAALRAGGDITVSRYNRALRWFSENWPKGAKWPKGVKRPARTVAA